MKKLLVLLTTLFLVAGCASKKTGTTTPETKKPEAKPTEKVESKKLKVTVTTSFLEDMINQLGKDLVETTLIIPAGEDPHTYEAKPEDTTKLSSADIVFYHGLHFEGKMIELLEKNHAVEVTKGFDQSKLLTLEEDGHKETDPHFWFDIDLYKQATTNAAKALQEKLPAQKDVIQANLDAYLKQLDEVKEYATKNISSIPKESRILITPHDAFSYFARQYDLEVKAPQGVSTDGEVDLKAMEETAQFIVDHKVKAIFAESTTDPKRMEKLQQSCADKGHKVKVVSGEGNELYSDSLAPKGQKGDTYIDMVKLNVDLITANLK